ncbi:ribosomal protein S6E (S10) [Caldisphaera lagunensis DSM 15908]|uniref:Small ribosomal subunit protein eS6 n=1 Tax=Caldisphaera lagunensis (strain DSM 15908 / JCM 11604 / ANMR 0165 / IC-154) TaxID=1056495 RepID=L0A8M6_CALLD|nr:30S ribosomal protein S6e [Caldisphaera lagunensis]AFZ70223.1 ribosomal protein S6E (S10) [Caldisphaera lagunensis DSM 15908]
MPAEERPPLRVVISDPKAGDKTVSVKVKGVDDNELKLNESMKKTKEQERKELPKAKVNKKLIEDLKLNEVGVLTLTIKKEGGKSNVPLKTIQDDKVPENEVWVSNELLGEIAGSNEADAIAFRAKAWQLAVPEDIMIRLSGLEIGDEFDGELLGFNNIKLKIKGGSDATGFPMHPGIPGAVRKKVLLSGPPGFHPEKEGERRKKTVRGRMIPDPRAERRKTALAQLNVEISYS